MNLLSICKTFATEDQALDYLIKSRWPDGVKCLACDCGKVYRIATKGKTGKPCRLFECADCGLHFSATTGTLFHDSHLPLQKWYMAMALMGEAKKGISANQVARHLGIQYKTAWYLCHRIRKAMQELNAPPIVDGYLQEFCWRFNRRHMQPFIFGTMLRELVTKKPFTYKTLTRVTF